MKIQSYTHRFLECFFVWIFFFSNQASAEPKKIPSAVVRLFQHPVIQDALNLTDAAMETEVSSEFLLNEYERLTHASIREWYEKYQNNIQSTIETNYEMMHALDFQMQSLGLDPGSVEVFVIGGSSEFLYHLGSRMSLVLKPAQFHVLSLSREGTLYLAKTHPKELNSDAAAYVKKYVSKHIAAGKNIIFLDTYYTGDSLREVAQIALQVKIDTHSASMIVPFGIDEEEYFYDQKNKVITRTSDFLTDWSKRSIEWNSTGRATPIPVLGVQPVRPYELAFAMDRAGRIFAHDKLLRFENGEPIFDGFPKVPEEGDPFWNRFETGEKYYQTRIKAILKARVLQHLGDDLGPRGILEKLRTDPLSLFTKMFLNQKNTVICIYVSRFFTPEIFNELKTNPTEWENLMSSLEKVIKMADVHDSEVQGRIQFLLGLLLEKHQKYGGGPNGAKTLLTDHRFHSVVLHVLKWSARSEKSVNPNYLLEAFSIELMREFSISEIQKLKESSPDLKSIFVQMKEGPIAHLLRGTAVIQKLTHTLDPCAALEGFKTK